MLLFPAAYFSRANEIHIPNNGKIIESGIDIGKIMNK